MLRWDTPERVCGLEVDSSLQPAGVLPWHGPVGPASHRGRLPQQSAHQLTGQSAGKGVNCSIQYNTVIRMSSRSHAARRMDFWQPYRSPLAFP